MGTGSSDAGRYRSQSSDHLALRQARPAQSRADVHRQCRRARSAWCGSGSCPGRQLNSVRRILLKRHRTVQSFAPPSLNLLLISKYGIILLMVLKQKTASLSLILAVSALLVTTSVPTEARLAPASSGESKDEGYLSRRAERLQKRVTLQYGITPSISALTSALKERQRLLRTTIAVRFLHEPVAGVASPDLWHVSLQRYPTWLTFHADRQHPSFQISQEIIKEELLDQYPTELRPPSDAAILSTKDDAYVTRADTDDFVRPGFVFDVHQAAVKLAKALDHHATHLALPATYESGRYYLVTENAITQLTMLSSGRSNFAKSPSGRRSNIRKALEQHLDHVLVPAGATFSFNETLETSIDGSEGWALSLIIVNGKDLQMAPGGGICQAATTAFRAVLLAGIPVLQRSNHSLYVSYYKDFGIGIDAAVYPGQQDF